MINHHDRHRIGQARLLRRQGKTYAEIRTIVGWVRDEDLGKWLKGIPRPAETRRGKAQDDLRRQCRRMRSTGLTYREIGEVTGASPGSLSLWLSDLPRDFDKATERRLARLRATCDRSREERLTRREEMIIDVSRQVGSMTDREVLLVGVALYWAEGTKSKQWRMRDRLTFINSDPTVIAVFMRWLTLVGVSRERCRFRVAIHETADVSKAESYWADLVGVGPATFSRATIKRHNPKTVRYNIGEDYRGCLVVDVLKSAELYRVVEGWWRGVSCGVPEPPSLVEPLG